LIIGFYVRVLAVLPTMGGVNSCLNHWLKKLKRKDSWQELSLCFVKIQFSVRSHFHPSKLKFVIVSGFWSLVRVPRTTVVATLVEHHLGFKAIHFDRRLIGSRIF
jgi:hypothetical protein